MVKIVVHKDRAYALHQINKSEPPLSGFDPPVRFSDFFTFLKKNQFQFDPLKPHNTHLVMNCEELLNCDSKYLDRLCNLYNFENRTLILWYPELKRTCKLYKRFKESTVYITGFTVEDVDEELNTCEFTYGVVHELCKLTNFNWGALANIFKLLESSEISSKAYEIHSIYENPSIGLLLRGWIDIEAAWKHQFEKPKSQACSSNNCIASYLCSKETASCKCKWADLHNVTDSYQASSTEFINFMSTLYWKACKDQDTKLAELYRLTILAIPAGLDCELAQELVKLGVKGNSSEGLSDALRAFINC